MCHLEPTSSIFVEYFARYVPPGHQCVPPHCPLGIQANNAIKCNVVHDSCRMELRDCSENMLFSRSDEINSLAIALEGQNGFGFWVFLFECMVWLQFLDLVLVVHEEHKHCTEAFGVNIDVEVVGYKFAPKQNRKCC